MTIAIAIAATGPTRLTPLAVCRGPGQVFSGGDAAKPLKVVLSASADAWARCWEAGLLGMRKGGVRYVAAAAAAVAGTAAAAGGGAPPLSKNPEIAASIEPNVAM